MEVIDLTEENIAEISERTGRTIEELEWEILSAKERGVVVKYYLDV